MDRDPVVEEHGLHVADVALGRQRLVALLLEVLVPVRIAREVVDTGDLEPDEVRRVVRDALGIRLREPTVTSVEKAKPSTARTIAIVSAGRIASAVACFLAAAAAAAGCGETGQA